MRENNIQTHYKKASGKYFNKKYKVLGMRKHKCVV